MKKHEVRGWIEETGILAAVGVDSAEDAFFPAEAIVEGGIPVIEIALTVPRATKVIAQLSRHSACLPAGAGLLAHGGGAVA